MRMKTNRLSTDRLCSSRYPAKNCASSFYGSCARTSVQMGASRQGHGGARPESIHCALGDKHERVISSKAARTGITVLGL